MVHDTTTSLAPGSLRVIICDANFATPDMVQETAARGLTMVYERGDKATKEDLVKSLISSFTGEKQTLAGNVSADTELFEPGALPTGDGSISTYKDVCYCWRYSISFDQSFQSKH